MMSNSVQIKTNKKSLLLLNILCLEKNLKIQTILKPERSLQSDVLDYSRNEMLLRSRFRQIRQGGARTAEREVNAAARGDGRVHTALTN